MDDIQSLFSLEWAQSNPVLRLGEPGYDRNVNRMKIGDGVTAWTSLPFLDDTVGNPITPDFDELDARYGPFVTGKPGMQYKMLLGALRNYKESGGFWKPIEDSAHRPTGLDGAKFTTDSQYIHVDYDFAGSGIGTVIAVPDETMSSEGFTMGSSVAADSCKIQLTRRKVISDYIYWDTPNAVFKSVTGKYFTVDSYTNGVLHLTHEPIYGDANNIQLTGRGGKYRPVVSDSGAPVETTTTKIEFWNANGTLATVGDPAMRVYVSRYDNRPFVDPRIAIDIDKQPFHNIWLWGLMEA